VLGMYIHIYRSRPIRYLTIRRYEYAGRWFFRGPHGPAHPYLFFSIISHLFFLFRPVLYSLSLSISKYNPHRRRRSLGCRSPAISK
jgi:hypothetical protein